MYKNVYIEQNSKVWKLEPESWRALVASVAPSGKAYDLDSYGAQLKKISHPLYRTTKGSIASTSPVTHPVFKVQDWADHDWKYEDEKLRQYDRPYDGYKVGDSAWIFKGVENVRSTVVHSFRLRGCKHYVVELESPTGPVFEVRDSRSMSRESATQLLPETKFPGEIPSAEAKKLGINFNLSQEAADDIEKLNAALRR